MDLIKAARNGNESQMISSPRDGSVRKSSFDELVQKYSKLDIDRNPNFETTFYTAKSKFEMK